MKLRKTTNVASKGADRKRPGSFARSAILVSVLVGASFGCIRNDTPNPAGRTENDRYRFSSDVWSQEVRGGSPTLAELPTVQTNEERSETSEFNSVKKVSVLIFPGDYVSLTTRYEFGTGEFVTVSDGIKARVSVASYKLKVRGIDKAGAEFELHEKRFIGMMAANKLDIALSPGERMRLSDTRSTELLAIFRVNFDGTETADIKFIEDLGVLDFCVEPAGKNKVRLSYTIPANE